MKFSEFYKLIESAGWTPAKEIPKGTLDSMMKKAGLKK